MIRALMLIIAPAATWEAVRTSRRSVLGILLLHVLPLLLLTSAVEAYGLVHWGEPQGGMAQVRKFAAGEAVIFVLGQLLLSLAALYIGALLVKSVGQTFHKRHTFEKSFRVVAFALAPLFLIRLLDAPVEVPIWLTWPIGIFLTMSVLYTGLPVVLEPDPPQAFGLFVMSSIWLFMLTGLVRLLTAFYLRGRMENVQDFVTTLGARLPF